MAKEVKGSVEGYEEVMEGMGDVWGLGVCFEEIEGGGKGFWDGVREGIVIEEGMSEGESVKRGIEEVSEGDLEGGEEKVIVGDGRDGGRREIEGERRGFVVCED